MFSNGYPLFAHYCASKFAVVALTQAAARASVSLSAQEEEALEYRKQLARRVDAGEITPAQFDRESQRTLRQLKAQRGGA